jgi:hypothetical protein
VRRIGVIYANNRSLVRLSSAQARRLKQRLPRGFPVDGPEVSFREADILQRITSHSIKGASAPASVEPAFQTEKEL